MANHNKERRTTKATDRGDKISELFHVLSPDFPGSHTEMSVPLQLDPGKRDQPSVNTAYDDDLGSFRISSPTESQRFPFSWTRVTIYAYTRAINYARLRTKTTMNFTRPTGRVLRVLRYIAAHELEDNSSHVIVFPRSINIVRTYMM